ncbi:ATP-binding protein [Candidatus Poribacteria bacterium]
MLREIVNIDEEKCNGCGLCVVACAEAAIEVIDGKAKLVSEIYCDGLGACLGECPEDAITIEKREAVEFDEEATEKHIEQLKQKEQKEKVPLTGCPGSMARQMERRPAATDDVPAEATPSELTNWPVQLMLVSPNAPYFQDADILLVADCAPFAMADFHARFLRGKPLIIGCPKLDDAGFYVEKLTELLKNSSPKSLTVVHMEVPCCSGLSYIASKALEASGVDIPTSDVTVSIQGEVLDETPSPMAYQRG